MARRLYAAPTADALATACSDSAYGSHADDEEYVEAPQEFYPGDRIKVVSDAKVKEVAAKGLRGVVTHFEFDDGYESCQTCSTSCPVTVLLEEQ